MSELIIKQGVFKEELKNRFLCLVEVDGKDTLCYIPSSCRLSNFVSLMNRSVLLLPVKSPNSKTKYSVYALYIQNKYVLLNLSMANAVVERSIRSRRFSDLGKRSHIRKEYTIDDYKSDLYIEDTKTIVEIKSILSFNTVAQFPSVYSQRAIDQLSKIILLLNKGYNVCYILVSLNPRVKQIVLNTEVTGYQELFKQCLKRGMKVKGVSLKMKNGEPIIHATLRVKVDL